MEKPVEGRYIRYAVIAIFAVLFVSGGFITYHFANRIVIDPASYAHAGKIVKEKFPLSYASSTDEEIGRKLYGKGYLTAEQHLGLRSVGLSDDEIAHLVTEKENSPTEKALWYVGFLTLWAAVFAAALAIVSSAFPSAGQASFREEASKRGEAVESEPEE
ncbi:MAG TPA: hypothetical protein VHF05_01985 [Candidatus Paceibacterota bacterium]|jgi:hypothetical protein|nr:hypothetical protein [Candidatus Paceibacterota bacterium]